MASKLDTSVYNSFLITNTAEIHAKQNKLNFTENGEIAIWDGVNEQIEYVVLPEYQGFTYYYTQNAVN